MLRTIVLVKQHAKLRYSLILQQSGTVLMHSWDVDTLVNPFPVVGLVSEPAEHRRSNLHFFKVRGDAEYLSWEYQLKFSINDGGRWLCRS